MPCSYTASYVNGKVNCFYWFLLSFLFAWFCFLLLFIGFVDFVLEISFCGILEAVPSLGESG